MIDEVLRVKPVIQVPQLEVLAVVIRKGQSREKDHDASPQFYAMQKSSHNFQRQKSLGSHSTYTNLASWFVQGSSEEKSPPPFFFSEENMFNLDSSFDSGVF